MLSPNQRDFLGMTINLVFLMLAFLSELAAQSSLFYPQGAIQAEKSRAASAYDDDDDFNI